MKKSFERWLQATLAPGDELSPAGDERIRNELRGAMRAREIRGRRGAGRGKIALAVCAVVLFVNPGLLGSGSRDLEPLGGSFYFDPVHDAGYGTNDDVSLEDLEENRDKRVTGDCTFEYLEFWRTMGQELWSDTYAYINQSGKRILSNGPEWVTQAMPRTTLSTANMVRLLPYLEQIEADVKAGKAWPLPPESRAIANMHIEFQVWRLSYPEIGEVVYGRGIQMGDAPDR